MIENQEELRKSLKKNRELTKQIKLLKSSKLDEPGDLSQLDMLKANSKALTEEVGRVKAERDGLCLEKNQLQEMLESLKKEKQQLQTDLDETMKTKETLHTEIRAVTEKLFSTEKQMDDLLSEREAGSRYSTEELEKLLCHVGSLSAERDQLQEILEGVRLEKQQLKEEFEEKMEMFALTEPNHTEADSGLQVDHEKLAPLQQEIVQLQDALQVVTEQKNKVEADLQHGREMMKTVTEKLEKTEAENHDLKLEKDAAHQSSSEKEKLLLRVTLLTEEKDQLQQFVQGLREEKQEFGAEMEERLKVAQAEVVSTQNHLRTVQEKLRDLMIMNSDLKKLCEEKERSLDDQINNLIAERNTLRSEKETERQTLMDEMNKLQEMTEEVRKDRRLKAEHQDRMLTLQNKETNTQASTEDVDLLLSKVSLLCEEKEQLLQALEGLAQEKQQLKAELEERVKMISAIQEKDCQPEQTKKGDVELHDEPLNEARETVSVLKEQPIATGQSSKEVKETLRLQLQDSTNHVQKSLGKFQDFINDCKRLKYPTVEKTLREKWSWKLTYMSSFPKATTEFYDAVCNRGMESIQSWTRIQKQLQLLPVGYKVIFKELVKDLDIFDEGRLQDLLLCRVQAPSYSVHDFDSLWKLRMNELLDKRQLYLQQMDSFLEKLTQNMASYLSCLNTEISERKKFEDELLAVVTEQPPNLALLDSILRRELERRDDEPQSKIELLEFIYEQSEQLEELKWQAAQAQSQLREERSKTFTLLQAMEGIPLKTEVSLLKDNQHLALQLQQAKEDIKALHVQIKELKEEQTNANNKMSNHIRATQLLQTELQDSHAIIKQKDTTIQTLKSSLQESKKTASPSAAEMEEMKNQLFKMEMKFSSASEEHDQEKSRMTTLLREKEASLRKLKETLRRSQQQGEESFLQGKDIHSRLTKPRGMMTESSFLLEKTKLEEEVKRLQLKITALESLVSSQQAEISKWRNRARDQQVEEQSHKTED